MDRELRFTELKTSRARRTMRLLLDVVERLREHRKDQMERRLKLGVEWTRPTVASCVIEATGVPSIPITSPGRSSGWRRKRVSSTHSSHLGDRVATQMARKGVHPHTVSTILGHSSTTFTMDVYKDAWDEGARGAAAGTRRSAQPVRDRC
jgi:hypothetical protein